MVFYETLAGIDTALRLAIADISGIDSQHGFGMMVNFLESFSKTRQFFLRICIWGDESIRIPVAILIRKLFT